MADKLTDEEEFILLFRKHIPYEPMPPALAARLQAIVLAEMTEMLQAIHETATAVELADSTTTMPDVWVYPT